MCDEVFKKNSVLKSKQQIVVVEGVLRSYFALLNKFQHFLRDMTFYFMKLYFSLFVVQMEQKRTLKLRD